MTLNLQTNTMSRVKVVILFLSTIIFLVPIIDYLKEKKRHYIAFYRNDNHISGFQDLEGIKKELKKVIKTSF